MITSFAPSFQQFQKDIERFLKSEGKCEKNEQKTPEVGDYLEMIARVEQRRKA